MAPRGSFRKPVLLLVVLLVVVVLAMVESSFVVLLAVLLAVVELPVDTFLHSTKYNDSLGQ